MGGLNKEYVGDGVYIQKGAFKGQFVLTTENGVDIENAIYLEYKMIKYIHNYTERIFTKDCRKLGNVITYTTVIKDDNDV